MKEGKQRDRILIISIIVVSFMIVLYSYSIKPLETELVPVSFTYSETSGFNIEKGKLTFGSLQTNQPSRRDMEILNDRNFPIRVNIKSSGETTPFLSVSENNFIIYPNESRNLNFIIMPDDTLTEYREYRGEVEVQVFKA